MQEVNVLPPQEAIETKISTIFLIEAMCIEIERHYLRNFILN